MSVVLVGFMGVGKTTIGKELSNHYHLSFIDIDQYIVETNNMSIADIFKRYGEKHFRNLEVEALQKWIDEDVIISTGGGIVESGMAKDILKKHDATYWLKCDIETVHARVGKDTNRPNAKGKSLEELKALYLKRKLSYNEIAFIEVDANQSKEIVVSEIIKSLNKNIFASDQS